MIPVSFKFADAPLAQPRTQSGAPASASEIHGNISLDSVPERQKHRVTTLTEFSDNASQRTIVHPDGSTTVEYYITQKCTRPGVYEKFQGTAYVRSEGEGEAFTHVFVQADPNIPVKRSRAVPLDEEDKARIRSGKNYAATTYRNDSARNVTEDTPEDGMYLNANEAQMEGMIAEQKIALLRAQGAEQVAQGMPRAFGKKAYIDKNIADQKNVYSSNIERARMADGQQHPSRESVLRRNGVQSALGAIAFLRKVRATGDFSKKVLRDDIKQLSVRSQENLDLILKYYPKAFDHGDNRYSL